MISRLQSVSHKICKRILLNIGRILVRLNQIPFPLELFIVFDGRSWCWLLYNRTPILLLLSCSQLNLYLQLQTACILRGRSKFFFFFSWKAKEDRIRVKKIGKLVYVSEPPADFFEKALLSARVIVSISFGPAAAIRCRIVSAPL